MKEIGRRIYYDKATGQVLVDTGERAGAVVEIPVETEVTYHEALSSKLMEEIGVLQLAYGERAEEFANMGGYEVDPGTEELIIYLK